MTDEEQFFAWLDGELDAETSARVAARVAADPELAAQARAHRALGAQLRGAFDPVMAAPVPDRILAAPTSLSAAREQRARRARGVPRWAAMAATLVLGLGIGIIAGDRGGQDPVRMDGARLMAAASLAQALDTQLASAGPAQGAERIGLTFRNRQGELCRSFSATAMAGVACRDGEQWRLEGLYTEGGAGSGDYRMASAGDPRLAELIDATMAGEPLDADGERAAMAAGWR